jgi:CheY-like chemotaxis protein
MKPKTILIADDEPNIQKMVSVCLQGEGVRLECVSNGLEASRFLEAHGADLLLLDLAMPVMDGMTLLAALHEAHRLPAQRIIVMTAHGSVRTAVRAIQLGASDFLEKPFSPDDLRLSVASVLDEVRIGRVEAGATYDDVLAAVRDALRQGKIGTAESLLMTAGTISDGDPGFLNLAGIVHEAHGRSASARRFYEKALALQPSFEPAQHNLNRLNEIRTKGIASSGISFGEDVAILNHSE